MKKVTVMLFCFFVLISTSCCGRHIIDEKTTGTELNHAKANFTSQSDVTEVTLKSARADFSGKGIDFDVIAVECTDGYCVRVLNGSTVLFEKYLSTYHIGWDSISLCRINGKSYILEYNPYMSMGFGAYSYSLYGYSESEKTFCAVDESCVQYDLNKQQIPYKQLDQFKEKINSYIENSSIIISTLNGNLLTCGKLEAVDLSSIRDDYTSID